MDNNLSYQQKVLLSAFELAKEYLGEKGYDFYFQKDNLIILTWKRANGRRRITSHLTVDHEKIIGHGESIIGELEKKMRELN